MTEKRFVIVSLSLGTATLLTLCCFGLCLSLLFNHRPAEPVADVPFVPHRGEVGQKEANELKYGPVNLDAAKEVKNGIIARIRARRAAACDPTYSTPCNPVTYATTPIAPLSYPPSYLPQPSQPVQPTLPSCPDGDCNQGYMPLPSSTDTPDVGSLETEIEAVPPVDSDKMQILVIASEGQAPSTWFDSDPILARVKRSVSFTRIDPGGIMHRERYGYLGSDTPIVSLTWGDGRSIYFAQRSTMPVNPDCLFTEMKLAVDAARNASPSEGIHQASLTTPSSANLPLWMMAASSLPQDCPDGNCPRIQPPNDGFRFPRLRPPSDGSDNPLLAVAEGFLKDSLSSGLWLVFSAVALGFVVLFSVLIFGAIIIVVRSIT